MSYGAGVVLGIAAGFTFNLGLVLQKVAVSRISTQRPLVGELLASPLWVAGLLTQLVIGTPLNFLSALRVGPAIVPGLLATGLIVLAVGAVVIAGESPGVVDVIGILLIGGAIALFGLSGLAVDMSAFAVWEPAFLARIAVFSVGLLAVAGLVRFLLARMQRQRGTARALDSGFLFALSNTWIAVGVGMLRSLLVGQSGASFLLTAVALLAAAGASALGVLETQHAFLLSDASRVVPIQQVPQQALPIVVYLAVFRLPPPSPIALPLVGTGVVLIIGGAVLLARRQAAVQ